VTGVSRCAATLRFRVLQTRQRGHLLTLCRGIVITVILSACSGVLAQQSDPYVVPLTEHGYPDLQGLWTNPSQTPLERPVHLGTTQGYSEAQAQSLVDRAQILDRARVAALDPHRSAPATGGIIDQQADGNYEIMPTEIARVRGEYRTSFIIDPENGRMPILSGSRDIYAEWREQGFGRFDGPEMRGVLERCLSPGTQVPLLGVFGGVGTGNPGGDNPVRNIQIVQNENYVVILGEYFSMVRIIRLSDETTNYPGDKWMGDSVAYYEGNSLMVYSNNFRPEQSTGILRSSGAFELSEEYTRVSGNELLLRYTVIDKNMYSEPFTAEIPLRRMDPKNKLYEYACHEGNYSLPAMLRAARMEEQGLLK